MKHFKVKHGDRVYRSQNVSLQDNLSSPCPVMKKARLYNDKTEFTTNITLKINVYFAPIWQIVYGKENTV